MSEIKALLTEYLWWGAFAVHAMFLSAPCPPKSNSKGKCSVASSNISLIVTFCSVVIFWKDQLQTTQAAKKNLFVNFHMIKVFSLLKPLWCIYSSVGGVLKFETTPVKKEDWPWSHLLKCYSSWFCMYNRLYRVSTSPVKEAKDVFLSILSCISLIHLLHLSSLVSTLSQ